MNTCFTHATFAETSRVKWRKKRKEKKKHAIMFKARLTSGHLGIATLRFHIYPTSSTIKRFRFKIHNQVL